MFTALKGAVDGDLDVSLTEKRFLVNDIESRSVWRSSLDGKEYKKQFFRYAEFSVTPDRIESMCSKAYAAVQADPSAKAKIDKKATKKRWTRVKTGLKARVGRPRKSGSQGNL